MRQIFKVNYYTEMGEWKSILWDTYEQAMKFADGIRSSVMSVHITEHWCSISVDAYIMRLTVLESVDPNEEEDGYDKSREYIQTILDELSEEEASVLAGTTSIIDTYTEDTIVFRDIYTGVRMTYFR